MNEIDEYIGNNRGVKIDYCRTSKYKPRGVKLSWVVEVDGELVRKNRFFDKFQELIDFIKGVKNEN